MRLQIRRGKCLTGQRATRLERATTSLEGYKPPMQGVSYQELTDGSQSACTNACTENAESGHGDLPGDADPTTAGASLADVLRMLDRLPLTDAERADAIRRLLAGGQ